MPENTKKKKIFFWRKGELYFFLLKKKCPDLNAEKFFCQFFFYFKKFSSPFYKIWIYLETTADFIDCRKDKFFVDKAASWANKIVEPLPSSALKGRKLRKFGVSFTSQYYLFHGKSGSEVASEGSRII